MGGSILGGRWSDHVLSKLKAKNGGRGNPEVRISPPLPVMIRRLIFFQMRLESTKVAMIFLPLSCVAYGWLCEKKIHIAAVCASLFLAGFFTMCASLCRISCFFFFIDTRKHSWIYSSTLAYIVDANNGRSSAAMATNSAFRGLFGFIAAEVAAPLQNSIGDGGLYTLWAGLLFVSELLVLLVILKGKKWREHAAAKESLRQM